MKIDDLTRAEIQNIKRMASGRRCDCHLTKPDICTRCVARALRALVRARG